MISRSADSARLTNLLRTLLAVAIGVVMYFAHAAFVPVALALLFALILSGPVEAMQRRRVPRGFSAVLIVVSLMATVSGGLNAVWVPAQQWFASAPQTVKTIKQKVRPVARVLDQIENIKSLAASNRGVGRAAAPANAALPVSVPVATPVAVPAESAPAMIFDATKSAFVALVTVVILTVFLLSGGPPMLARMTAALAGEGNSRQTLKIIEQVRAEVGRFYLTTALINVGLGCATAAAMMLCGMPNPVLWGILAACLNFVPYAGSATTLVLLSAVAIVSFDGLSRVLAVAGSYLVLATLEGQVVQPLLVGRRLALNPMLVFLALWFGGLYWGVAGILLATPTLVTVKVFAEHSRHAKPILAFLSPAPAAASARRTPVPESVPINAAAAPTKDSAGV